MVYLHLMEEGKGRGEVTSVINQAMQHKALRGLACLVPEEAGSENSASDHGSHLESHQLAPLHHNGALLAWPSTRTNNNEPLILQTTTKHYLHLIQGRD